VIDHLTRLIRIAIAVFVVAFALTLAFASLIGPPERLYEIVLVASTTLLLLASGLACVGIFFARELVLWKRGRWRFSLGRLLLVMTLLAIALGLIAAFI
jgi:hypothetical protein